MQIAYSTEQQSGSAHTLLLPSEVADALRYHIESVRRAIRQGRIKAIKAGRQWRVPRAELDRLLREGL